MIFFFSNSGESLPIVERIKQEGYPASIYVHCPDYEKNYRGMLKTVELKKVRAAVDKAELVVFDITRINEGMKHDRALLHLFRIGNKTSVFGPIADKLRVQGKKVVGCSTWSENIEFDRQLGATIAEKIGLKIPRGESFSSLSAGKTFLAANKNRLWVLKPHNNSDLDLTYVEKFKGELLEKMNADLAGRLTGRFMLQEKIDGVEISTEAWWNGTAWVNFNHTIEAKRLMNDDLGPSIGSQSNTVWVEPRCFIADAFNRLTPYVKRAGYIGPVDINCVVKDRKPYFLEFSPRFGYDALFNLLNLLDGDISTFFTNRFVSSFKPGFSSSQRVSVPPFPNSEPSLLMKYANDIPVNYGPDFWALDVYENDGRRCAGADGILGVQTGYGETLDESVAALYKSIKGLKIGGYAQYRTDGMNAKKRYDEFKNV